MSRLLSTRATGLVRIKELIALSFFLRRIWPRLVAGSLVVTVILSSQSCSLFTPSPRLDDHFSFGLVRQGRTYYVDSYGEPVVLLYNDQAVDPSYQQLVDFLNSDQTDLFPYDSSAIGTLPSFSRGDPLRLVDIRFWRGVAEGTQAQPVPRICSDFAQTLHNNAELRGIRAGYVSINFASTSPGRRGYRVQHN